eukprot:11807521-Karenia_brevis.AAC.1
MYRLFSQANVGKWLLHASGYLHLCKNDALRCIVSKLCVEHRVVDQTRCSNHPNHGQDVDDDDDDDDSDDQDDDDEDDDDDDDVDDDDDD